MSDGGSVCVNDGVTRPEFSCFRAIMADISQVIVFCVITTLSKTSLLRHFGRMCCRHLCGE
jgi:hypothetical protein